MSAVDGLGARDAAIAAKAPIGSLGGAWMSVPEEEQLGASLDFHDWQFYYLGRHGVLGDVDPDVVLAAAYIFPPEYLRQEWTVARSIMTPAEGLRHYLTLCHGWGRSVMGGWAGSPDGARCPCRTTPVPASRTCARCCASIAAPATESPWSRCRCTR